MVVYPIEVNFLAKEYGDIFSNDVSLSHWHSEKSGKQEAHMLPGDSIAERPGPMKALAINTCSKKDKGAISRLLDPFIKGIRDAGADVEIHYASDLTIFPCCGNLNCTIRTPGKCMAYDDMRWLRERIGKADVLILASPLYFNGTTGPEGATPSMRSLLGRLVPGTQTSTEIPYEHAIHTIRKSVNLRKIVFVSGCGFWEIDGFYPVLTHIKALCYNTFPDFAGCISGGQGVLLRGALENGASDDDIMETCVNAGRQLVQEWMTLSEDTGSADREHLTRDMCSRVTNELKTIR